MSYDGAQGNLGLSTSDNENFPSKGIHQVKSGASSQLRDELDESFINPAWSNKNKNCWQKLEDYWWYNNHALFEEHASQKKALVSTPHRVFLIRLFCCLVMLYNWISAIVSQQIMISNIRFLTRWGVFFMNVVNLLGLYHTPYKKIGNDGQKTWKKYNPFALWKWYI